MAPKNTENHPTMPPFRGHAPPATTNEVRPDDVLFGRGSGPNTNPGNKVFRSIILNHAADYESVDTRVQRRLVVQKVMAVIRQTKTRFLRKINGGCQAHLAINKKLRGSPASSKCGGDLFEIISDPEAIYQKVKLALRYSGGYGKKNKKHRPDGVAAAKPKVAVTNENALHKTEHGQMLLGQPILSIHTQRAVVLPAQDHRPAVPGQELKPNAVPRPVVSPPSPSGSPPRNYHGHHGGDDAGPPLVLLPDLPIGMPFAMMAPAPASSFCHLDGDSRTLQELACLVALNHRRSSERQHQAEEVRSAVAGLLAQRALQQLQAQRTAFLESLINNDNHDAMLRRGP